MDNGGGDGGGGFKIKPGSDAAEVTDVHKTEAREVRDVVGERKKRIKSNTKIADKSIRDESSGRRVIIQVY